MMKTVLVTGATGFIGNHVVEELLAKGFQVIATSLNAKKAAEKSWFSKVRYIPFDFRSFSPGVDYYSFFEQPDLMIHLAWEGLPNYNSEFHIEENLPRHYQLLENLIQHGLDDLSVTGTCFEYGLQEGVLSEDMVPQPSNAYAIAKDRLRVRLTSLKDQSNYSFKWIRLFYMYGEGQSPKSLLSQLEAALERGDEEFNMSPGDQLRDYLEVRKVAEYIVAIATQNEVEGIINCCSGRPIQVRHLVEEYLRTRGKTIKLNLGVYPYSDIEPMNFWGDPSKLKTILKHG